MTTSISTGRFVWFDYVTPDPKKAQAFFGEVFNWKTQEVPVTGKEPYTMIALGESTIGGYVTTPQGAPPVGHWISSLGVTDAKRACEQITQLGGKVHKPAEKMGDYGTMAIVADPQGAAFALWQPAKADGTGDYRDAPGAFIWNELAAHDPIAAVGFYTKLGFTEQKMDMGPMGTYHVLNADGKGRAGVMKTPMANLPSYWMPYVQVRSVDDTLAKAQKLGGKVAVPAGDVPGVGRIGVFVDPQGGYTGLLTPSPDMKS